MHKYTRTRPEYNLQQFFLTTIGYVQRRMSRWGKRQLSPKSLKFEKYQKFLGSDKAIFEQQNIIFLRSDRTYLAKIRIFLAAQGRIWENKVFLFRKRLRFEVRSIFFLERSPLVWNKNCEIRDRSTH